MLSYIHSETEQGLVMAEENGKKQKRGMPIAECPVCHEPVYEKTQVCKKCGYKGYMNMSKQRMNFIKTILFVALMAIAVVLIVATRIR